MHFYKNIKHPISAKIFQICLLIYVNCDIINNVGLERLDKKIPKG